MSAFVIDKILDAFALLFFGLYFAARLGLGSIVDGGVLNLLAWLAFMWAMAKFLITKQIIHDRTAPHA